MGGWGKRTGSVVEISEKFVYPGASVVLWTGPSDERPRRVSHLSMRY